MPSVYNTVFVSSAAPTLVLPANNERKGSILGNNGPSTIYLGFDQSVTTSTGVALVAGATLTNSGREDGWRGAIYAIASTGTSDVRYWEWA